jgi:type I restriction enzyme S subunit
MKQLPQYKNSPIGPIPTDWEVKKLGDIGRVRMCKRIFSHQTSEIGDIPFYKIGTFGKVPDSFISKELYEEFVKKYPYPRKGDILISAAGTLGRTVVFDGAKSYFQDSNIVWIDNNEKLVLNKYLSFIYGIVKYNSEGGTIKRLYNNIIENAKFPLPPLQEQQKIAEVLSTWDKVIRDTDAIIKKLEDRNKALAFSLLRGKLVNNNSKKIPLSKFLTFTPREIEKPTENYLALGIRSHGKGIFHKPDSDPKVISMDKLYEVKENDFIVNITFAWEHAVAIISKEDEGGLVSHRFPTYVIDQKTVSVEFFRHIILQPFFKQMLDNISPGGAGRNRVLNKKELLKLEIPVPSLEEQYSIAEILNTSKQELKQYQEKAEALKQQKKGLMQQLLTGKVRTI